MPELGAELNHDTPQEASGGSVINPLLAALVAHAPPEEPGRAPASQLPAVPEEQPQPKTVVLEPQPQGQPELRPQLQPQPQSEPQSKPDFESLSGPEVQPGTEQQPAWDTSAAWPDILAPAGTIPLDEFSCTREGVPVSRVGHSPWGTEAAAGGCARSRPYVYKTCSRAMPYTRKATAAAPAKGRAGHVPPAAARAALAAPPRALAGSGNRMGGDPAVRSADRGSAEGATPDGGPGRNPVPVAISRTHASAAAVEVVAAPRLSTDAVIIPQAIEPATRG